MTIIYLKDSCSCENGQPVCINRDSCANANCGAGCCDNCERSIYDFDTDEVSCGCQRRTE